MLAAFKKRRPKNVLAVYVEPRRIEVLRAQRHWRSWQINPVERFPLPEGESVHDSLQRLNLCPKGKRSTALILFLPRTYYNFHREYYPLSLQDQLEEVLDFDWPENIFYEHERMLYFNGPSTHATYQSIVPVFSLHREVYEKFYQVLDGESFRSFIVIPSVLAYGSLLPSRSGSSEETFSRHEILGRELDRNHLEIHRFHEGSLVDSLLLSKNRNVLSLFRETLHCLDEEDSEEKVQIQLFCGDGECHETYGKEWMEENLPVKVRPLKDSVLFYWMQHFLKQDEIRTFDAPLYLKPWKVPKVAFPLLVLIGLYSLFAFYQLKENSQILEAAKDLKIQRAQLETQWKPIEQLQTRITQLQENQGPLAKFGQDGYPVLQLITLLSTVTPDDTWLNYLSLKDGKLTLRGESKSAVKYLSELSKVEGFENVQFASPVSSIPNSDKERLVVNIQLNPEKLRKTLSSVALEGKEKPLKTQVLDNDTVS